MYELYGYQTCRSYLCIVHGIDFQPSRSLRLEALQQGLLIVPWESISLVVRHMYNWSKWIFPASPRWLKSKWRVAMLQINGFDGFAVGIWGVVTHTSTTSIYIHIHMYIYTHTSIYVHTYTYIPVHTHTYSFGGGVRKNANYRKKQNYGKQEL